MRIEEVRELIVARPFVPFRITLTEGSSYDVRHPDFLLLTPTLVTLGINPDPASRLAERIVHCSPLHIAKIEMLQAA